MTVKLLHHSIRNRGGYHDEIDLSLIMQLAHPKLWIFDFCAVWMFLLKSERFACRILQDKLCQKSKILLRVFMPVRSIVDESELSTHSICLTH